MLQNKLLTFYFELKLQVRRMENISLTEICRLLASCSGSSCLNPFYDKFMTHLWKGENLRQFTS